MNSILKIGFFALTVRVPESLLMVGAPNAESRQIKTLESLILLSKRKILRQGGLSFIMRLNASLLSEKKTPISIGPKGCMN